jgi:uncharacterized protein (TIGR02001 family)
MARRIREVGIVKALVLGATLVAGLASTAQAQDDGKKLTLGGTAALTTDYIFRGISQTTNNPAVQASIDATYGIFYLGAWGSNIDFGSVIPGKDVGNIEIDYYGGIKPVWGGVTFDFGILGYTYPGYCESECGLAEPDYLELKAAASYTFNEKLTLGIANYYSPDFFGNTGSADAVEGSAAYAIGWKPFNFFTPTVSGLIGYQDVEDIGDYTYWNAGLTLGFMERWSADIRYWDTDLSDLGCVGFSGFDGNCDERVVGTIKAVF